MIKGILCSLTACFTKVVKAVVIFNPKSANNSSACFFNSSSMRIVTLVVAIIITSLSCLFITLGYNSIFMSKLYSFTCALSIPRTSKSQMQHRIASNAAKSQKIPCKTPSVQAPASALTPHCPAGVIFLFFTYLLYLSHKHPLHSPISPGRIAGPLAA